MIPLKYMPRLKRVTVKEDVYKRQLPGSRFLFAAVRSGERVFAVVGIDMEKKPIPAFEEGVMGAILNECAFALEKEALLVQDVYKRQTLHWED